MSALPLAGFRVIDCSTVIAGPVTATLLADFGAEVIKVELPEGAAQRRRHAIRLQEERNKRSLALDLRKAGAAEILLKLVDWADALIENFRPGTLESWGLGPERLLARNPRLIIHRLSAYGQTGPWRTLGGYDREAQAFAGSTYVTGFPGSPPLRSGYAVADYMAAMCGAFGILVAAYWRDLRGGTGQVSDLALFEPIFRASEAAATEFSLTGRVRERSETNPHVVPAAQFLTRDQRWIAINANSDKQWQALARAIGRADLADDPRYQMPRRVEQADEVYAMLSEWVAARTYEEVQQALNKARVPAAPVLNIAEIVQHEQYLAREAVVPVDCGDLGSLLMAGVFPKLSATPGKIRSAGPRVGEHTREILREIVGLSTQEIEQLARDGVIANTD